MHFIFNEVLEFRRACLAQRFIPLAQTLFIGHAREQAAFCLFIEFVVDQGDELGIISGHRK